MQNKKIAIFHHFLLSHCKGGGEKLMLQLREALNADFWAGSIDLKSWNPELCKDSFTEDLGKGEWSYLAEESNVFGWKYIKRQLAFMFSRDVKELAKNDIVIFSFGNIAFVPQRVKKIKPNIKTVAYIHTPPRIFTDQSERIQKEMNWFLRPFFGVFKKLVLWNFTNALKACDYVICNSENIKNRIKKYCDFEAHDVIFPLVEVANFEYKSSAGFYLSHARLEPLKRIDLIVKAFEQLPDQKLIITSGGPMSKWIKEYIQERKIKNIDFRGRVSDEERDELMSTCKAGIYIPIDEDAGITQLEFMACGKPVIGVNDGGLIESIIDGKTGFMMSKNPDLNELINTIEVVNKIDLATMKDNCISQAKKFDKNVFMTKFQKILDTKLGM
ncbi:MAG: glycosyltransferase [Patescibacteria group bacterium]